MDIASQMRQVAINARKASRTIGYALSEQKNVFLKNLAELLSQRENYLLEANKKDMEAAAATGMDCSRLDRLRLTPAIIRQMSEACLHMAALSDPVGALESQWKRPNGMLAGKMRVPLGVIAMIYEARPNVTVDAAIICIKAGNAVILRGGSEALQSNLALASLLRQALKKVGLPEDAAQLVSVKSHEAVTELCKLDEYIDVMIPRGGENLVKAVCAAAAMPVLKHYKGVCHLYVDDSADIAKTCDIVENAKTQRPGVCNALECLLVHKNIADKFLPALARQLEPHNVEYRACPVSLPLLGRNAVAQKAEDLGCEFHAAILAVRVVKDMDDALEHISMYGSNHTEVICANDYGKVMRFVREVDASMVGANVSTRFNDGGQLGLGAEIGISTSKLHAYGPMGVNELTTTKFVVLGNGQIRH